MWRKNVPLRGTSFLGARLSEMTQIPIDARQTRPLKEAIAAGAAVVGLATVLWVSAYGPMALGGASHAGPSPSAPSSDQPSAGGHKP
jgi:hypothetical protein